MPRDLHENKVPVDWVSATLNPRRLKVERSRNRADWYAISPQIPYPPGKTSQTRL